MNDTVSNAAAKVNLVLAKMDLPIGRKDASKQETVRWLLTNMRVRNSNHEHYNATFVTLLGMAKEQKLFRAKELETLEKDHNERNNRTQAIAR